MHPVIALQKAGQKIYFAKLVFKFTIKGEF